MIIKKFTEKMEIVHSSEIDKWPTSTKKEKIKTGSKTLDLNLGAKVIDLLAEYGLGIETIYEKNWLEKISLILPDEKNFIEYRVKINKRQDWKFFIEDYEIDNDVKYDKLSEEEQEKIQEIYNELPYDTSDDYSEFSVFLPTNVDTTRLNYAAMADASNYLKFLSESKLNNVLDGSADSRYMLTDEIEGVKKFTILKNIKITNDNLEILPNIGYRLYKDSKAIYCFEQLLDSKYESSNLFKEWINLIK